MQIAAAALAAAVSLPVQRLEAPPMFSSSARGPAEAAVVESPTGALLGEAALLERLAQAELVLVGEQHDLAAHHLVQAEIFGRLLALKPGLQLGLEMLDAEQQPVLEDYLAGRMGEEEFAAFWKRKWGFDFALYRPVLDLARRSGARVHALNAPGDVVKAVAKGGLASLTPEQRARIPASIPPIRDARYLAYVKKSLGGHGPVSPEREARMLEAMAVWNETMARSALRALAQGPLLVIAGSGHMMYRSGIAEYAAGHAAVLTAVVLPYPLDDESVPVEELLRRLREPGSDDLSFADYFWLRGS